MLLLLSLTQLVCCALSFEYPSRHAVPFIPHTDPAYRVHGYAGTVPTRAKAYFDERFLGKSGANGYVGFYQAYQGELHQPILIKVDLKNMTKGDYKMQILEHVDTKGRCNAKVLYEISVVVTVQEGDWVTQFIREPADEYYFTLRDDGSVFSGSILGRPLRFVKGSKPVMCSVIGISDEAAWLDTDDIDRTGNGEHDYLPWFAGK